MDSGSDDRGVSQPGEAVGRGGQEADSSILDAIDPEQPCFTEEELKRLGILPVPEWARRLPKTDGPSLFDDLE